MIDTSAAREKVLAGIRAALQTPSLPSSIDPSAKWAELSRPYRRSSTQEQEDVLSLLTDRLQDYDAHVVRASAVEVADTVAGLLAARGIRQMLLPQGVPPGWLPAGVEFVTDEPVGEPPRQLTPAELDRFAGVLTGATLAIAETGTLVLQNVPGQGRRAATLVPDYHLCIVNTADVVATVPEAMDRLHATATLPTTFISGPSATADIEMTRIKGVHGPRFLDVVLLGS